MNVSCLAYSSTESVLRLMLILSLHRCRQTLREALGQKFNLGPRDDFSFKFVLICIKKNTKFLALGHSLVVGI